MLIQNSSINVSLPIRWPYLVHFVKKRKPGQGEGEVEADSCWAAMAAPSVMRLLRWESVFFLSDEAFHLVRAASDLGVLLDALLHGPATMAALVRVWSSVFLLAFHILFLGPRTSLASDAAVLFGDMQFHFFHMLLATWQLVHYLWSVRKRETRPFIANWLSFLLHTGLVWIYSNGIQVSVRNHIERLAAGNPPRRAPPQGAPPEDGAAGATAAAARAADTAAARVASHRRNSTTPHGSPLDAPQPGPSCTAPHCSSQAPRSAPADVFRELGNPPEPQSRLPMSRPEPGTAATDTPLVRQERTDTTIESRRRSLIRCVDSEARNSDGGAGALTGSATQTLSAPRSNSSSSALAPYVDRETNPRSLSGEIASLPDNQALGNEGSNIADVPPTDNCTAAATSVGTAVGMAERTSDP